MNSRRLEKLKCKVTIDTDSDVGTVGEDIEYNEERFHKIRGFIEFSSILV